MNQVRIVNNLNQPIAILENAFKIGYEKSVNKLWRAWFSMPGDDEKLSYCQPFAYVEIWENGERVELFRIVPFEITKGENITYDFECEHVLATLLDDVLFQYHEIGGTGIFTTTIINYVLARQTVTNWQLGTNAFNRQFLYKWENENLLGSLFSIPNLFLEPYKWSFDTTAYPWTVNLDAINDDVKSYVRYRKNLKGITKSVDATQLCTRLYCLGYGEGVNQLDIKSVTGGKGYLDATTQTKYGIVSKIWVDRRYEDVESLKAAGQAMLNELQTPYTSYEIDVADITYITDDPDDKFIVGTYTRVIDEEIGEDVKALIIAVNKSDIDNVSEVKLTIANKPMDVAQSISDLSDRQRINEVYSQGATNLDSKDFADNCDPSNPAIIEFYIPEETVRINKMELNLRTEAFRAYSKAIDGGGAFADTTSSGGGGSTTSESGGGISTSTNSGGGVAATSNVQILRTGISQDQTAGVGNHNHGISSGTALMVVGGGSVTFAESGGHAHSLYNHAHEISIPNHNHGFSVPNHSHSVSIPNHTHGLGIPNHTHDIEFGIFQSFALPSQVTLKIDGNAVSGYDLQRNQLNIIPFLSKDGGGRVNRGWHTITATPNNLARIVINMAAQIFVQSRGGGDF